FSERNWNKIGAALVVKENVRFSILVEIATRPDLEPADQIGIGGRAAIEGGDPLLAIDHLKGEPGIKHVHESRQAIVYEVEIQPAIAIHIRQGDGFAAALWIKH